MMISQGENASGKEEKASGNEEKASAFEEKPFFKEEKAFSGLTQRISSKRGSVPNVGEDVSTKGEKRLEHGKTWLE